MKRNLTPLTTVSVLFVSPAIVMLFGTVFGAHYTIAQGVAAFILFCVGGYMMLLPLIVENL
jgi:hypothetical protein